MGEEYAPLETGYEKPSAPFPKEKIGKIIKNPLKHLKFFESKRNQWIMVLVLLLLIVFISSYARVQNVPLLKDEITQEYSPKGVDAFYFLRVAETIVEGGLPPTDLLRYPSLNLKFLPEILPRAIVLFYRIANIFGETSLQYIDVISPVIFYAFSLIAFFFLVYVLTRSKITSLLSTTFLSIFPSYVQRTLAGFADHDVIGMFAFFLTLLVYGLAMRHLYKNKKNLTKTALFALAVGFLSAFAVVSWTGISYFVFLIVPLSFFILYLLEISREEAFLKERLNCFLTFYGIWFLSTIIFGLFFGFNLSTMMSVVFLSFSSMFNGGIFLFLIIDYFLIKKKGNNKSRLWISLLITGGAGLIFILFRMDLSFLLYRILNPFGAELIGSTIIENVRIYLVDWISSMGKAFFGLFFVGVSLVGVGISKGIKSRKRKIIFSLLWIFMISGILLNAISSTSLLNGENFISRFFYFASILLFVVYCVWVYFKETPRIPPEKILIASWIFFMLIIGKEALRLLFVVTPLIVFMGCSVGEKLFLSYKKSSEDLDKFLLLLGVVLFSLFLIFSFYAYSKNLSEMNDAGHTILTPQEQKAMGWIKENAPEDSLFVSWWDYGYWIQYFGERPTLTDGGHAAALWDYFVGRYVLTTPQPETALSFMKSHNATHLLIDPTDLLKYPSHSKIGSGPGGTDRISIIPLMKLLPENSGENGSFYQGSYLMVEDIIFEHEGKTLFLPAERYSANAISILIKDGSFEQPVVMFLKDNTQFNIPVRYLYTKEGMKDFGSGLEAAVKVIPSIDYDEQVEITKNGAVLFIPPNALDSLIIQLYLLSSKEKDYPYFDLIHSEPSLIVEDLKKGGVNIGEIFLIQGRLEGPIKIWEVNPPSNILSHEEFLENNEDYVNLDNLTFTR